MVPSVGPGTWRLNYRSPQGEELADLIHAVVWPKVSSPPEAAGQWLVEMNPGRHEGQVPQLLRAVASRLGLLPLSFAPDFERALKDNGAICLVADTNSIYHGSLYQALRLRKGKPTTVMVPDQVLMELQRRRGRAPAKSKDKDPPPLRDRLVQAARYNLPLVGARLLSRIRHELRYVVNQARPPEAMVRYFGSDAGDRGEDESSAPVDSAGPNFQRDRLILEVVRHSPTLLPPGIPVWLATGDADMAAQAECEGFHVGFCWVPDKPARFALTSPHIDARTGTMHFVPWDSFVEELVWNLGGISLQRAGERSKLEYRLPEARHRILGERGVSWPASSVQKSTAEPWLLKNAAGSGDAGSAAGNASQPRPAARKAPAAQSLLKFLLLSTGANGVPADDVYDPVRPYLTALDWADLTESSYRASSRGSDLATRWRPLSRNSVEEHASWLKDAARDLLRLQPVSTIRDALQSRSKAEASDLATALKWSERDVQSQARFLAAFGLIVRVGRHHWSVIPVDRATGADLVLQQIRQLRSGGGSAAGVIRADVLFRHLLESRPLSLVDFRLALWDLYKGGRIRPGGSVPPSDKTETVSVELLIPGEANEPVVETIDLGAGDFLLPGESSQAVRLLEAP